MTDPVGLVVVSHSRALAGAAVALAQEMLHGTPLRIEVAAGLDETTFGTDAGRIVEAVTAADRGSGVVVLMDLGSAVLSAEVALDLLDDAARDRVLLSPAPLVEGLLVAAVAAAGGAGRDEVAAEAAAALSGKTAHLDGPAPEPASPERDAVPDELTGTVTVANPHGLHARPAARVVQTVRMLDARVALRNHTTGSAWVPASSLSKVATLGVLRGHEVEIRAGGAQAREALDDLLALAARDFDEDATQDPAPAPAHPVSAAAGQSLPASPGVGIGPAWSARTPSRAAPLTRRTDDRAADDPAVEWSRLEEAITAVRGGVHRVRAHAVREVGEPAAAIFDAHLLLLDDVDMLAEVRALVDGGRSVATAWSTTLARVEADLAALPDPYLQARSADVAAVGGQVLAALLGDTDGAPTATTATGVLVTGDLTPAEAADLDRERVAAVVQAFGSPSAHSAILLRARGIPAVVAVGAEVLGVADGTLIAVDGTRGQVVVAPSGPVQDEFRERASAIARREQAARLRASSPAVTSDGVEVEVGANVGSVDDARAAAAAGADLAGLVRSEFLFLGRSAAPDVDEQEAVYRSIAEALHGRRITLRTLDVGGDKPLPYLPMAAEANPFLGVRGIRLSLARRQLLADQLLAVVRVAHDVPVDLMFPMVSTREELLAARTMLDEAVKLAGGGEPAGLRVGMMVEVPAAALKARAFAPHVDFFSVGTNDLTQYALAAERGNDAVSAIADPFDPGLLQLVHAVCRAGRPVAVCGELAADESATALLVGLGVRELSVAPRAVPGIKQAVRALDGHAAASLATAALDAPTAADVRERLGDGAVRS